MAESSFQIGPYHGHSDGSTPSSNVDNRSTYARSNYAKSMYGSPEDKYAVMVKYLHSRINVNMWMSAMGEHRLSNILPFYGVLLRQSRGVYVTQPSELNPELLAAVQKINVEVAFTMATETSDMIFGGLHEHQTELVLADGAQYQIVDSLADINRGASNYIKRFQYACLVRRERIVLVWHDDIQMILTHAQEVETKLLGLIWGQGVPSILPRNPFGSSANISSMSTPTPSIHMGSTVQRGSAMSGYFGITRKTPEEVVEVVVDGTELEKGGPPARESLARPVMFTSAIMVGLAVGLLLFVLFMSVGNMLYESMLDKTYIRFALVAAIPILGLFGLFFFITVLGSLFQLIGPITGAVSNSRYHSAIAPDIAEAEMLGFGRPHMTIQMPVYKESLDGVIKPTVASLKEAISHYELCGGSANIFINDDGLQLISEEEAQARINYYHDNNIGWVARPGHGVDGFVRAGKFKKASNMNYALNLSNKVEEYVVAGVAELTEKGGVISSLEEENLYQTALERVIKEDGKARAGGNVRIGEHILIIDSDTRVPADCLLYGAAEMFLSPEVAIIQHSSGVMQVVGDYFENGIAFFTKMIYTSIRFSIGNGEVAPFMGHNSFLRWSAVQSVATRHPELGYEMYWSESHVSEDFDIALRLQINNNIIRFGTYHGEAFKEGVSLTIFDEVTRWEKYAYGCNELVFNPLYTWPWKGPFTKLFRRFLWSPIPLSSKITTIAYIATYYAIASGLPFSLLNYFLIGWYPFYIDTFYIKSWNTLIGLLVVFGVIGNFSMSVLKYRLGLKSLLPAMLENFMWAPMFLVFFGGMSFQINMAILSHMFSINMEWGATAKEKENSNFFKEIPKILKTFKYMYMFIIPIVGGMIYLGVAAPPGWEITNFDAIVPLAMNVGSHFLVPFLLNPSLTVFNY